MKAKLSSRVALSAVVAAAIFGATGAWFHGAGGVRAPEPARLNSTLYGTGSTPITYVYTRTQGNAIFLSGSWTPSNAPAGMPCSTTYPVAAGTILYNVVYASGSYRKCQ